MNILDRLWMVRSNRSASNLIDKNLQAHRGISNAAQHGGGGRGRAMVRDLWRRLPELSVDVARPQPVLVAAAALALAIGDAERGQDEVNTEALHRALRLLWLADFAPPGRENPLSPPDARLFALARSALRAPWLPED